jgi:type II secretory pathway component PulF
MAVLPWPMILFQYLFILPRYDKLFHQYKVSVDGWTALCLNVSAWVRNFSVFAFIVTIMLTACCVMTANFVLTLPFSRRRRNLFLLLSFGLPCALFILSWLGVLATHSKLVEGLQR